MPLIILFISSNPVWAGDKFGTAVNLFNNQLYKEALSLFSSYTDGGEKESQRLYYCALCYLHTKQIDKAQQLFFHICKNHPGTRAAQLSLQYLNANESKIRTDNVEKRKQEPDPHPDELSIPFSRTASGQIAVEGELQGRRMPMIFDTGAEESLFGMNQLEAANLASVERTKQTVLHSVSGPVKAFEIVANIKLGSLARSLPVCIQEHEMTAGILGQPFFKGYSYVVDNQAGLIRLRKSAKITNPMLDSFAVPFTKVGDKMIVSTIVNGLITDMCFDTGAFGVCMSKKQCERAGLKLPETPLVQTRGPNGQQVSGWEITADLSLGAIQKKACPIRVLDSDMSFPLLGLNFFGNRLYTIDYARKEIRFAR